jgi:predicted metalloprotease
MKWREMRQSGNVEDRRGASPGRLGGLTRGGLGRGGLGIGGLLVLLVIGWLLGGDPLSLLNPDAGTGVPPMTGSPAAPAGATPADDAGKFVTSVLGDTEDTWSSIFQSVGSRYPAPTLVLFTDEVQSACGFSSAAVGPFYCPRDRRVYIDLGFFAELDRRFGAPGDFAQAYVIAHEVGHHVQNVLGLLSSGAGLSQTAANRQSVQQELQADCFAGLWGRSAATRGLLETGDVEEGLNAAAAIGDDRLQRASQGRVVPESFTHGSSAERVAAVRRGLNATSLRDCGVG